MKSKRCSICGLDRPIASFSRRMRDKKRRRLQCKDCMKKHYQACVSERPRLYWSIFSYGNHRRRGATISVTRQYVTDLAEQTDNCVICGVTLDWLPGKGGPRPTSPSLDQIVPGQGLREGNLQIVCHQCNRTKGERTMKEFIEYCQLVLRRTT